LIQSSRISALHNQAQKKSILTDKVAELKSTVNEVPIIIPDVSTTEDIGASAPKHQKTALLE